MLGSIVLVVYFLATYQPSTTSIAKDIVVGHMLTYKGDRFRSEWAEESTIISGYLRRKDRHYDKNLPIITYDIVLTSGDFNNPDIVEVKHQGGGNYIWRYQNGAKGTILVYHTIPATEEIQRDLDLMKEGDTITLTVKVSLNSKIETGDGNFFQLLHDNHKLVIVDNVLISQN